jgi:hypothetical protein
MALIQLLLTLTSSGLAGARSGDGDAFRALVGPHLRALHVHSYRMLARTPAAYGLFTGPDCRRRRNCRRWSSVVKFCDRYLRRHVSEGVFDDDRYLIPVRRD